MRITSAYHPQSNGLDERTNQTLKRYMCILLLSHLCMMLMLYICRSISKLMENPSDDWCQYLDSALYATNTSVQNSTKYTPFRIMFGRNPRFPLEAEKVAESVSVDKVVNDFSQADINGYICGVIENQKTVFSTADNNIRIAQEKQKKHYAQRKGIVEYNFRIGDKVLRRNMQQKTRKGKKMEDRWLGPYTIVEISTTSCLLKNNMGKVFKQRINLCQLKPFLETLQEKPALPKELSSELEGNKPSCIKGTQY